MASKAAGLKECPFCGEAPEMLKAGGFFVPSCSNVNCAACHNDGGSNGWNQKQFAIKAWNRRAKPKKKGAEK